MVFWSWLSFPTVEVLGVQLKSSGLAQVPGHTEKSSWLCFFFCPLTPVLLLLLRKLHVSKMLSPLPCSKGVEGAGWPDLEL